MKYLTENNEPFFFLEKGDKKYVMSSMDDLHLVCYGKRDNFSAGQQQPDLKVHPRDDIFEEKQLSHKISHRFCKEDMFTWKVSKKIIKRLSKYDGTYNKYFLAENKNLKYLRNLYDSKLKQFYWSYV